MKFKINLEYDFEYKGYITECSTLPGCMSQGKTKKEAIKNIKEAIKGYLKAMKAREKTSIPQETFQTRLVNVGI